MPFTPLSFPSDPRITMVVMGTGANDRPVHDRIVAEQRFGLMAMADIHRPGRLFAAEVWVRSFGEEAHEWACAAHFGDQDEARRWCHDVLVAWLDNRLDRFVGERPIWYERPQRAGEPWCRMSVDQDMPGRGAR